MSEHGERSNLANRERLAGGVDGPAPKAQERGR